VTWQPAGITIEASGLMRLVNHVEATRTFIRQVAPARQEVSLRLSLLCCQTISAERPFVTAVIVNHRCAKPSDVPFERPTKFDLRIDLRIARTLASSCSDPDCRADKVIE